MNIPDITLEAALKDCTKPVDKGDREDMYKVLLIGLVIKGDFNWEKPHVDFLRCWNLAKPAAEVMERT